MKRLERLKIGEKKREKKKKPPIKIIFSPVSLVSYFVNTPKSIGDVFDLFVIIETFERNHALMERIDSRLDMNFKNCIDLVVKRICPFIYFSRTPYILNIDNFLLFRVMIDFIWDKIELVFKLYQVHHIPISSLYIHSMAKSFEYRREIVNLIVEMMNFVICI